MSGQDITVYEAGDRLGGAFSLAGDAATGYILPTGAVFDSEFRCTFDLLATIPSARDPAIPSRTISSPSMSATHITTRHTSSIETAVSCTAGISASARATGSTLCG